MKQVRYGLLLFTLALLISCTILSLFIEEQMTVPVNTVRGRNTERSAGGCALPQEAVQEDEDSYFVFAVKEQNGIRKTIVAERQDIVLMEAGDGLAVTNGDVGQDYIRYAARTVSDGVRLQPVKEAETVLDTYLVFPADGSNLQIVEVREAPALFMEEQVRESLEKQGIYVERVYSLSEVAALYACCPKLALAVVLCLAPFFLLAPTCMVLHLLRGGKKILIGNGVLCVGVWAALIAVLHDVHLPASLLPDKNIFDFFHYNTLLQQIQNALSMESLVLKKESALSVVIVLIGVFALVALTLAELLIIKENTTVGKHGRKIGVNTTTKSIQHSGKPVVHRSEGAQKKERFAVKANSPKGKHYESKSWKDE